MICLRTIVVLLLFVFAAENRLVAAPVAISVDSVTLAPNGTGTVSVWLTGSNDAVSVSGFEFQITPDASASSQLRFLEEEEGFLAATSYLFVGNSSAADDGAASSVGSVNTTVLPNDTFVGGDGTSDFGNVIADGTSILVQLQVQHLVGPADPSTTVDHQFSISLVPTSGDSSVFLAGGSNTGFLDASFNPVAFTSTAGTIAIIPEPSSVMLLPMIAAATVRRRR